MYVQCNFDRAYLSLYQLRFLASQTHARGCKINFEQCLICVDHGISLQNFDLCRLSEDEKEKLKHYVETV